MNILWLNFPFQPNINVETTWGHQYWIDVILSTLIQRWCVCWVGVPQGFIPGLLLFNIYICDIFLLIEKTTVNSYADDTTHFSNGTSVVLNDMENKTFNVFDSFLKNYLKINPDKWIFCLHPHRKTSMKIEGCI